MKIILVTQDAPMYLPQFLDGFLKLMSMSHHKVDRIVVLSPLFNKNVIQEMEDRYSYYGFFDFLNMSARVFKNKLLSAISRIFRSSKCYSVKDVIRKYGLLEYEVGESIGDDFIKYIKDKKIDLLVSVASPKIFKKPLIDAPLKGCINYHSSLLPKYRGRQPLFWALLHDEKEAGISVHEMDEKLDNGDIIVQKKVKIEPDESLHSLYSKTIKIGPKILFDAIEKIDKNYKIRIKNDQKKSTTYRFPTKKDARLFRSKGGKFF